MRIFVLFEGSRMTIDIDDDRTVLDIKEMVRDYFSLGPDQGPSGVEGQVRKTLAISFFGAVLNESWPLSEVGVVPSSTLRAFMKDEVKPVLYLYTTFNREKISLLDKINMQKWTVADLRGIATRKTGIPLGVFRLVSKDGVEMFDCHTLDEYNLRVTDTVNVETWDGWNEFLYLATRGATDQVMERLSPNELIQRYQMKVALHISAHFGHVDLAATIMRPGSHFPHIRQDIRADEPVGDHPERMWCSDDSTAHQDSLKTPVHEAAEFGQLGVLHLFVTNNVCSVLARDGKGLTPLNLALRNKQRACASFLLTKQWSKISLVNNPKAALPMKIYVKMKKWADKAKDKVLIIHGQLKSSVRNTRRQVQHGALIGQGVLVDGFSKSKMTSKATHQVIKEKMEEQKASARSEAYDGAWKLGHGETEFYFEHLSFKLPGINKKGTSKKRKGSEENPKMLDDSETKSSGSIENTSSGTPDSRQKHLPNRVGSGSTGEPDRVKLPPIQESLASSQGLSKSEENISLSGADGEKNTVAMITKSYMKFKKQAGSAFIQTGLQNRTKMEDIENAANDKMTDKLKPNKNKKDAMMMATNNEAGISLPMVSLDRSPRPFFVARKDNPITKTMHEYTRYRGGVDSRDNAIKCMSVANNCREKAWLHQVRQAMFISGRSVRRPTVQPPLVVNEHIHPDTPFSELSENMTTREGTVIST